MKEKTPWLRIAFTWKVLSWSCWIMGFSILKAHKKAVLFWKSIFILFQFLCISNCLVLLLFIILVGTELPENQNGPAQQQPTTAHQISMETVATTTTTPTSNAAAAPASVSSPTSSANVSSSAGVFSGMMLRASATAGLAQSSQSPTSFSSLLCAMEPVSLSLSSSLYLSDNAPSLFPTSSQDQPRHYATNAQPAALSATALLQKAAQIGATTSGSSFLRGLGLALPSSSDLQDTNIPTTAGNIASGINWSSHVKPENGCFVVPGLGLGLPSDTSPAVMMGPPTMYTVKPTTLDLLGLGIGPDGAPSDGFSAYLTSIGGGGLDVAAAASSFGNVNMSGNSWDDSSSDRKPTFL